MNDVKAIRRLADTDSAHIREAKARVAAGEDEYVPIEVTKRLMAGGVPVRPTREHRGRARISAVYLSSIKTSGNPGSLESMAKLARSGGFRAVVELSAIKSHAPFREITHLRRQCRGIF